MQTRIGLDAITMIVSGEHVERHVDYEERRNGQGKVFLTVKGQKNGMFRVVVIPCAIVRDNNLEPYSFGDVKKLKKIVRCIERELKAILGVNELGGMAVKAIEVNSNRVIRRKRVDADMVVALLEHATLVPKTENRPVKDIQTISHMHAEYTANNMKKKVHDGFQTARDSSGRYKLKVYRKDRQIKMEGKMPPVIRLEMVYNMRGVRHMLGKEEIGLERLLQAESLCQIIKQYAIDMNSVIVPQLQIFLEAAVKTVYNDLKEGEGAYKTLLKHYEVVKYDYEIFRKALRRYYRLVGNTRESAKVQCSRLKRTLIEHDNLTISDGTVKELSGLFRDVRKVSMDC